MIWLLFGNTSKFLSQVMTIRHVAKMMNMTKKVRKQWPRHFTLRNVRHGLSYLFLRWSIDIKSPTVISKIILRVVSKLIQGLTLNENRLSTYPIVKRRMYKTWLVIMEYNNSYSISNLFRQFSKIRLLIPHFWSMVL